MKILIASDCYKPTINGVVTSISNLKEGLEARGHEVRVLTLSNTKRSYTQGDAYFIGSHDLGKIYPGVIRFQTCNTRKEMRDIIQWHPDVIHTQSEFFTFFMAKRIARRLSIPMVHTYHTIYEDYTHYFSASRRVGKKVVVKATNYVGRRVSCMVAPTAKIEHMLHRYGVKCPVHTVPTGISLEKFTTPATAEQLAALKAQLNIPAENTVLLSVSRIGKEKRIDEIIQYMDALKGTSFSFVIVGDGPARERLQKMIDKLELNDTVQFVGMVAPDLVPLYYQMADLFVSASTSETQGLTYIEALAAGTPLLCRKDECLEGVLEEGQNGYAFTDQENFMQYLAQLTNQDMQAQLCANAKKTAEKFTKDVFVQNIAALYETYTR